MIAEFDIKEIWNYRLVDLAKAVLSEMQERGLLYIYREREDYSEPPNQIKTYAIKNAEVEYLDRDLLKIELKSAEWKPVV